MPTPREGFVIVADLGDAYVATTIPERRYATGSKTEPWTDRKRHARVWPTEEAAKAQVRVLVGLTDAPRIAQVALIHPYATATLKHSCSGESRPRKPWQTPKPCKAAPSLWEARMPWCRRHAPTERVKRQEATMKRLDDKAKAARRRNATLERGFDALALLRQLRPLLAEGKAVVIQPRTKTAKQILTLTEPIE